MRSFFRHLEEVRTAMFRQKAEAEEARKNFLKKIDELEADLKKKEWSITMINREREEENQRKVEVENECSRMQDLLEELERSKELLNKASTHVYNKKDDES